MRFSESLPKITYEKIEENGTVDFPSVLGSFIRFNDSTAVEYASYGVLRGGKLLGVHQSEITGKAKIHNELCYEIASTYNHFSNSKKCQSISYSKIKDEKVQTLAIFEEYPDGVKVLYTFKDKHFMENLSVGDNNEGMSVSLKFSGETSVDGLNIKNKNAKFGTYDLVGKYKLSIDNNEHEVYRLAYFAHENQFSDFFINEDGIEIMHRFYIPNHGYDGSRKDNPYSEDYPDVEVIQVNSMSSILSTIEISEKAFR